MERITIEDFLETLAKTKFFIEQETREYYADCEWPNNFLPSDTLLNIAVDVSSSLPSPFSTVIYSRFH
jgi:hypothetical protein